MRESSRVEGQASAAPISKPLLGYWRVAKASIEGEPYAEAVGAVYVFQDDGRLKIYGHDYEALMQLRHDPAKSPKELASYFSTPSLAGSGIYELTEDTLRWRTAEDEQPMSFTSAPSGFWDEHELKRITEADAAPLIEALKDERLRIKASNP